MAELPDQPGSHDRVGPKIAKSNVARHLKDLREQAGLSAGAAAESMDWSVSKLARIEKGEVSIHPLEIRALLRCYGVTDAYKIGQLARLARISRSRQWYSRHRLTGDYAEFVAFENEAVALQTWQLLFIPGLLQTPEYACAITARTLRADPDDEQVKARVALRMDRQQALFERFDGPGAPHMTAVIDESVLRRPIGGREVMARQLDHLLTLAADTEKFAIGVTPLDLVQHSGLGGSFELLRFSGSSHEDVLFVEGAAGADFLLTDRNLTERHNALFRDLLDYGWTGARALDLIRAIRDEMRAG